MSKHVYIIAEGGVNHNGSIDLAFRLCNEAKKAGADAIKFQTWKTEKIVTRQAGLATYQEANINDKQESQYEMLKKLELSYKQFRKIREYCQYIGIEFISTPDEEESLEFLCELGMPFLKIGSGEVTNLPYLRKIGSKHEDVILSTGMAYLSDVDVAYRTLIDFGAKSVSLLHCTTNYPCPKNEVNLRAMLTLKESFKCRVGYSDHTMGGEVSIAAVAMGAEIIEKHFTLDKTMDGPDHKASLEPQELKNMISGIRNIELALGDGIKRPNPSEKNISTVVLKHIVADCPIKRGEIISEDKLALKRSPNGITANMWDLVIGRISNRDYNIDDPIEL